MNFWHTVTHELRTPQFVQQPKSCMTDDDIQRSQKTVSTKHYFSDRLNRLIDKILDLENLKQENRNFTFLKKIFKTITNTLDSVKN
jgi:signal transduction histidine kinase